MKTRIARLRLRAALAVLALSIAAIAAIVLAAWLLAQSLAAGRLEREATAAAARDRELAAAASQLLQSVTDAETSQRGFLLMGRPESLRAFAAAQAHAEAALAGLAATAPRDASAERTLALTRARLGRLASGLNLARDGRRAEAEDNLAEGARLMSALRSEVAAVQAAAEARERRVREERRRQVGRMQALQAGQLIATLVGLAIAIGALVAERVAARLADGLQAELAAELEAARHAAEEADRAKSRFLAAASHDMRQPLHALTLYIAALERRVESAQAPEILANMDGAVRTMARLFTALLDMARLEAGVLKPEPIDFAVDELLRDVAEHSRDLRAGAAVQVAVAPTRLRVHSDPDLLEIILRNLASNAVKHSRGGRVLIGCRRVGGAVRIEVWDDGQGISQDELPRLFGEFVRGERASGAEGVGLGLAIVDRMAKLLEHPLAVRSAVGRGSVFALTVPRARDAAPGRSGAPDPPAPPPLRGARVLVADDEPLALDAVARCLRDAGAEVTAGRSAGELRTAAGEPFDLYVVDLDLGGDDGLELLEELERRRGARIRGLVVTGSTGSGVLARLRSSGRPWLTKPLSADDLLAAAGRLLAVSPA